MAQGCGVIYGTLPAGQGGRSALDPAEEAVYCVMTDAIVAMTTPWNKWGGRVHRVTQ